MHPVRDTDLGSILTARSSERAVILWASALTAASFLAVIETITAAGILPALLTVAFPGRLAVLSRLALIFISAAALWLGPFALVFTTPFALAVGGIPRTAFPAAFALTATCLLSPQLQSLPDPPFFGMSAGSLGSLFLPCAGASIIFARIIGWQGIILILSGSVAILAAIAIGAERWINVSVFTSTFFRTPVVLVPVCFAIYHVRNLRGFSQADFGRWLAVAASAGAFVSVIMPTAPISSVYFDEAHGRWATIAASFEPSSFGRSVNYTYSLLSSYAARSVGEVAAFESEDAPLPAPNALFVLKMPIKPLSAAFSERLSRWVRSGGRLLVVADHTDLYDTAQNLNQLTNRHFGAEIKSDAVFDFRGMPASASDSAVAALFARIQAGDLLSWQTGSSFSKLPINSIALATFGMSFSEPGDYSRPNRFGPFNPLVSLRYQNHAAVAAFSVGSGAVCIILDSTPWSNFSLFMEQYKRLFRGIVWTLSNPLGLFICGWGSIALLMLALISSVWISRFSISIGALVLGLVLGSGAKIGFAAFESPKEGVDFSLKVIAGSDANFEFLKQLVPPGKRNYSRITSAMAKYGLDPSASTPGSGAVGLAKASRWLLVDPDAGQLPKSERLFEHLKRGGDLTVLFSPERASQTAILKWLEGLGLYTKETTALSVSEDANGQPGLLSRRGPVLLRDARAVTAAVPESLLKFDRGDQFFQSYTLRPTKVPRTSGYLNISFSADQFSDAAIGDVWEGIQPASLGRLRERQLAAVLTGKDLPDPFPDGLKMPQRQIDDVLSSFLVLEDGAKVLSGRFNTGAANMAGGGSPIESPVRYLVALKETAISFVRESCPAKTGLTKCEERFLGPDMVEWAVSWAADKDGVPVALELLHERSFSGLGTTLNVVFAR